MGYKASGGVAEEQWAEEQWAIAFTGPSNQVLQIAARDPQEHIYSYAKVRCIYIYVIYTCNLNYIVN